ncbi:MAG: hypothetical protein DCC75_11570, partial [Proteobacteria bacterium]
MARSGLASSQSCHRGVFMVLTAGSIFALMVMTALAVDLSFLYLSKRRWDRIAQAACLAALEQYLLTDESQVQDDPDPFAQKREAARLRAQGLIGFNTLAYRPLASGGNLQNALLVRQSDGSHGANGYVEFGRWNFEDSEFERAENLDDPVYAVNLAINLANESPLQGFFSKMISQGEFWLRAASTCSVTPRHMEIAFDLSRSMVGITHRPWEASPIPFNPNEVPTQQIVTQYSPAEFFYPVYSNYDTDRWNDITIEPLTNIDQWPPTNYCNNIQPSMPAGVNILPSNTSVGPDNPLFVRVGSPNQPLPSQSTQDDDVSMLCPLAWWRQGLFDPTPGLIYHHMRWNRNRGSTEEKNDPAIHFMTDYKSISVRLRRCGSYVAMRECYQACDQSADHETLFDCLFDNPSCQPTSAAACSSAGAAGLIDTGWAHMGRSPRTYGPRPLTDVYIGV